MQEISLVGQEVEMSVSPVSRYGSGTTKTTSVEQNRFLITIATPVHSAASSTFRILFVTDAELSAVIEKGKGKTSSNGKSMNADEVKAMVAYVRSLGK